NNNSPVVFFPRIVNNNTTRNTLMQGYAEIKYNLNPFGVAIADYDANGLLTQTAEQVSFRSTGSGATPSTNFQQVGSSIKTFGDITVKYRPTGNPNTWFPKASDNNSLYIALQVKNTKAAANQQFVASQYHLAKEEIIEADEVTIEKAVKASTTSKYELVSGYATSAFNTGTGQFTE